MKKLDWIAAQGGMALLNTHPDYMAFNGSSPREMEYPCHFYERLLQYIESRYSGAYWSALPREVAAHVVENQSALSNSDESKKFAASSAPVMAYQLVSTHANVVAPAAKSVSESNAMANTISNPVSLSQQPRGENVNVGVTGSKPAKDSGRPKRFARRRAAVVVYSEFPADPRPCRAAEALAEEGMVVDVISLRGSGTEPQRETLGGINIRRVALQRRRGGKFAYAFQYSAFIAISFTLLSFRSLFRRYHVVHVHNMPDVLVFSALIPKLLGAKVILDLHDPMPELMMTIFGLPPGSRAVRLLKKTEKWSTAFADLVLTVNEASKRIYTSRSCKPEKVRVIMNSPDEKTFAFRPVPSAISTGTSQRRPFTIMYHGSLLERNGFDIAVDALELLRSSVPEATLVVCGERTAFFEKVMASVRNRGLQEAVKYLGRQNRSQIVMTIEDCDIGIIPNRRNLFTEMNTPTRIFEYLSRGKPVITPRARGIQDYFTEDDLLFFELGNSRDLAEKLQFAFFHPDELQAIVQRGQQVYLAHRWSCEKGVFVECVESLLLRNFRAVAALDRSASRSPARNP